MTIKSFDKTCTGPALHSAALSNEIFVRCKRTGCRYFPALIPLRGGVILNNDPAARQEVRRMRKERTEKRFDANENILNVRTQCLAPQKSTASKTSAPHRPQPELTLIAISSQAAHLAGQAPPRRQGSACTVLRNHWSRRRRRRRRRRRGAMGAAARHGDRRRPAARARRRARGGGGAPRARRRAVGLGRRRRRGGGGDTAREGRFGPVRDPARSRARLCACRME